MRFYLDVCPAEKVKKKALSENVQGGRVLPTSYLFRTSVFPRPPVAPQRRYSLLRQQESRTQEKSTIMRYGHAGILMAGTSDEQRLTLVWSHYAMSFRRDTSIILCYIHHQPPFRHFAVTMPPAMLHLCSLRESMLKAFSCLKFPENEPSIDPPPPSRPLA